MVLTYWVPVLLRLQEAPILISCRVTTACSVRRIQFDFVLIYLSVLCFCQAACLYACSHALVEYSVENASSNVFLVLQIRTSSNATCSSCSS